MKRLMFTILTVAMLSMISATPMVQAQRLNARELPSDTQWVTHVQWNSLLRGKFGKALIKETKEYKLLLPFEKQMAQYGLDLHKEISAFTIVGTDYTPKDTVLVLDIQTNPDQVIQKIQQFPDYQSSQIGEQELHSWVPKSTKSEEDKSAEEAQPARQYLAIKEDELGSSTKVLIGLGSGQMLKCLDVLDGTQRSLASVKEARPLIKDTQSAKITLISRDLGKLFSGNARSQLLKKAKSCRIMLHEKADDINIDMDLEFEDADSAKPAMNMLRGIFALMQLQDPKNEEEAEVRKLFEDIDFTLVDRKVQMKMKAPSALMAKHLDKVLIMIQSGASQLNQPAEEKS